MKKSLIFNNGEPMFSPNLKTGATGKISPLEKMAVLSEIELMDTCGKWLAQGNDLGDHYKELAMIYSAVYDENIAMSNLLLTFQGAIVQLDVDRKLFIDKKGENEKTTEALKRNQMFMRVHQEFSAALERNNQMKLMLKNALEKVMQYKDENAALKRQVELNEKTFKEL